MAEAVTSIGAGWRVSGGSICTRLACHNGLFEVFCRISGFHDRFQMLRLICGAVYWPRSSFFDVKHQAPALVFESSKAHVASRGFRQVLGVKNDVLLRAELAASEAAQQRQALQELEKKTKSLAMEVRLRSRHGNEHE